MCEKNVNHHDRIKWTNDDSVITIKRWNAKIIYLEKGDNGCYWLSYLSSRYIVYGLGIKVSPGSRFHKTQRKWSSFDCFICGEIERHGNKKLSCWTPTYIMIASEAIYLPWEIDYMMIITYVPNGYHEYPGLRNAFLRFSTLDTVDLHLVFSLFIG